MDKLRILVIFVCVFICRQVFSDNFFTVNNTKRLIPINITQTEYTESTIITPFSEKESSISGLCVSGSIEKESDDYMVRLLLVDKDGHEFCILESYNMINDAPIFTFSDYCEETALLDRVVPVNIIIIIHKAKLILNSVSLVNYSERSALQYNMYSSTKEIIRKNQVKSIVNNINSYNRTHRKLWGADVTPLSLKSYEEKKKLFDLNNEASTYGFEYYNCGIFEDGTLTRANRTESTCIDKFDWCDRHGRNWMTHIKDQGNSEFCFAFAAVAGIESMLMLHYNSTDSVLLSDDMAARCTPWDNGENPYIYGGYSSDVLQYAKEYGIYDEASCPFVDNSTTPCRKDMVIPNEIVKITNYQGFANTSNDYVKEKLINYGPLVSGYRGHAMLLVGYGVIKVGDTIRVNYGYGNTTNNLIVQPSDTNYIGQTYWKFKNSMGYNMYKTVDGYTYILFNDLYNMRQPYAVFEPYRTVNTTANKIICEDKDGDGYYFWGLANKPVWCPSWVPNTPDGDDSDFSKGQMLNSPIGTLEELNPNGSSALIITGNVTFTSNQNKYSHIVITAGSTLTVKSVLNMFGRVTINILSGGQLIIDGGVITNVEVSLSSGGKIAITNGGTMVMRTNTDFMAPTGAIVDIQHGSIIRSCDF